MLAVPKLDETSYNSLVQKARLLIPHFAPEWTDLNDHDPGITTLQTLAWLVDNLDFYIDATGEIHKLKYLQLLGIVPTRKVSEGFIMLLPTKAHKDYDEYNALTVEVCKGDKFVAGDVSGTESIIFEAVEAFDENRIINPYSALYRNKPLYNVPKEDDILRGNIIPKDSRINQFVEAGESVGVFTKEHNAFYIEFNFPLEGEFRFYMDITANPHRKAYDDLNGFPNINLKWRYWDGKQWHINISSTKDETHSLRTNGFITLNIPNSSDSKGESKKNAKYYLQVVLDLNEMEYYDELPSIKGVYTDCINVKQTNTITGLTFYKDLPPSEKLEWRKPLLGCANERRWLRNVPNIHELTLAEILITEEDKKEEEEKKIDIVEKYLSENVEDKLYTINNTWSELKQEQKEEQEKDYKARIFDFDRLSGDIVFGDGFNGRQPNAGTCLIPKEVVISLWDKGNVRSKQINTSISDNGKLWNERVTITNPKRTKNGINNSSSADLENELRKKLQTPTRVVTKGDYIHVVKQTPGLMIDKVNVIDSATYVNCYGGKAQKGVMYVVVKPYVESNKEGKNDIHPRLRNWCKNVIYSHIDKYRLLTTNIQIISVSYAHVEVSFAVRLFKNTKAARDSVRVKLKELVEQNEFGDTIVYSFIYSEIELLPDVAEVMSLDLFCDRTYAEKTEQGNIKINPDALAYLGDVYGQFAEVEGAGE